MRNALRAVAVDFVSEFVLFLSKLTVAAVIGLAAYMYLGANGSSLGTINYPIFTVVLSVIAGFMIATAFFSVYQMAIDTIFLSFLEDVEKNDGSDDRPYYMTDSLKKIMGVENEAPRVQKTARIVPESYEDEYEEVKVKKSKANSQKPQGKSGQKKKKTTVVNEF